MDDNVRDAIESARTARLSDRGREGSAPRPRIPFGKVKAIVLAVARELPEGMTMMELREQLGE